jgi:tetraacyldisaccharide 4'-kinase
MNLADLCHRIWYQRHPLMWLLAPFGWIFQLVMAGRDLLYRSGVLPMHPAGVPVIVVGNLTVGGTGKTPLVLWLADYLRELGYHPGIVSRGYGGHVSDKPQQVRTDSEPALVGDEAVMLARRSGCPVAVCRQRYLAASGLVEHAGCDVIISDDGLQHLSLARDIEIAIIDGQLRFGNGLCLPAGPLREGKGRLQRVHAIVCNGRPQRGEHGMEYQAGDLLPLSGEPCEAQALSTWHGRTVHAVAGLGNPQRFYALLRAHDIQYIPHEFPDHHRFTLDELQFDDDYPVVMTEKDAVKCEHLQLNNAWYLPVNAVLPRTFEYRLNHLLKELADG